MSTQPSMMRRTAEAACGGYISAASAHASSYARDPLRCRCPHANNGAEPRTPARHAHAHANRHGLDGERPVVGGAEVVATAAKGRGANPREPHAVGVERVARMPAPLAWVKCARTRGRETDTAAPRETDTAAPRETTQLTQRTHACMRARSACVRSEGRARAGERMRWAARAALEQLAARLVARLRSRNEAQRRLRPACQSSLPAAQERRGAAGVDWPRKEAVTVTRDGGRHAM